MSVFAWLVGAAASVPLGLGVYRLSGDPAAAFDFFAFAAVVIAHFSHVIDKAMGCR